MSLKVTYEDLNKRYEEMTIRITCLCQFSTAMVGGQPADEEGLRAFIEHQLGLTGDEAEEAFKRISTDEIIEHDVTPAGGEVEEKLSYGIRALRKDSQGRPWIGDWMIKACLKQAATQVNLFMERRGSKSRVAEGGRIQAIGDSLKDQNHLEQVFISLSGPTFYEKFHGRVRVGMQLKSIVHDSECVPTESLFAFEFRMIRGFGDSAVTDQDLVDLLAMMMNCGLGSARSLERGHFRILEAQISDAAKPRERKTTKVGDEKLAKRADELKTEMVKLPEEPVAA